MELIWNALPRAEWDAFHRRHGGALQQAWAYGEAMHKLGVGVHRAAVMAEGRLLGLAQFVCRRWLAYVAMASCSRGPVWAPEADGALRQRACRQMQRSVPTRPWRVTLFSHNSTAADLLPGEVARLGRVMTGYSTVMLDLRPDLATLRQGLESKWRNRLTHAEKENQAPVQVQPRLDHALTLLLHERHLREARHFHGLPESFVPAYIEAHPQPQTAFTVSSVEVDGELLAGMLFLLHGRVATYHMGWSSQAGRANNLHNLLLWKGLCQLKSQGISHLDLGGVNTHDLPGISRFKLGTGGQVLRLAGTYF
ncbi:MAG: GNAT family N-acetyltransferase [Betaproteobacteria bacterium]|nr:GNAT family N-acetyltransferase [Betaproteobacteria bacterium]